MSGISTDKALSIYSKASLVPLPFLGLAVSATGTPAQVISADDSTSTVIDAADNQLHITGVLDGGSGINILDYTAATSGIGLNVAKLSNSRVRANPDKNNVLIGDSSDRIWRIIGVNSGSYEGSSITVDFKDVGNGNVESSVEGFDGDDVFEITGDRTGIIINSNGTLSFANFGTVDGRAGDDKLILKTAAIDTDYQCLLQPVTAACLALALGLAVLDLSRLNN